MSVSGLDALLRSLLTWTATIGRPVHYERVGDDELPALLLSTWAHSAPDVDALGGLVARRAGVTFTSVGRSEVDAQWLDAKVMELLTSGLPTGLEVEILTIVPESGAALEPGEGRMLATHRVALAYR